MEITVDQLLIKIGQLTMLLDIANARAARAEAALVEATKDNADSESK
jgi:hypothetical protein